MKGLWGMQLKSQCLGYLCGSDLIAQTQEGLALGTEGNKGVEMGLASKGRDQTLVEYQ